MDLAELLLKLFEVSKFWIIVATKITKTLDLASNHEQQSIRLQDDDDAAATD